MNALFEWFIYIDSNELCLLNDFILEQYVLMQILG